MRQRKLITGKTVEDTPAMVTQKIISYAPLKWLRVDLEHGQVYDSTDRYIGKAIYNSPGNITLFIEDSND